MPPPLPARLLVLNGTSSSGKTTLARALQRELPGPWLRFSIDDLIAAMPRTPDGLSFGRGGEVQVGPAFHELERAWRRGLTEIARAGVGVLVDDVFLGGQVSQERWRAAAGNLPVRFVRVDCALTVAEAREQGRGDRTPGMARQQAPLVHQGVTYDLRVDTTRGEPGALARTLALQLLQLADFSAAPGPPPGPR